ncbi:GC-rich sequence DNA-binding factor 2 isoform X1 [Hypomesus transpacificus]|uniref:GC-rich sequence DNA-binding factor 2 isoform X1 n=1 Tax=Hypomesus transpacificus TaxID=137520 RepID=UPI001F0761DC|nr:GC-rich sequence DNA-binding factor 2 isoform X1 [Hypomesus transpacificus]
MFNKKVRRNIRQRKGESSDEDEQKDGSVDDIKVVHPAAVNIKPSKLPQNRGISCSSKREVTPPKSDSSGDEDPGQVGGPFAVRSRNVDVGKKKKGNVLSFSDEKEGKVSEFKVKKLADKAVVFQARKKEDSLAKTTFRPAGTARRNVTRAESPLRPSGSDDDGASGEELSPDSDPEEEAKSTSSSASSKTSKPSAPKKVVIPDARRITAARRQRQEARAQKEYIPLGREGERSPSNPGDLDRDEGSDGHEDDDDEPDDHERRIEFAPRPRTVRERIAEKLGGSASEDSDSQEREDQELWEEQQIGKGVKRHPGEQSPSSDSSVCSGRGRLKKRAVIPETLPAVTVSMVKRRITGKLDSLRGVHRAREAELRRMEGDMEGARTALENLENSSSDRQLSFYRDMNLYVRNLVECLREKVVEINSLELDMHSLLSDQAEALLSRRRETVQLESSRLQQLCYSSDPQSEGESGDLSGDHLNETLVKGDEDSDSLPADSEPSAEEEEELQKKKAELVSRSQGVFADVQEEFWDVRKVLRRFEEWRSLFSESYHSAYISLCLPKLLNPLIRHQILGWSPLQSAVEDFEALPWYSAVEAFCHGDGYEEKENADRKTLPAIIEKTLLPKIQGYVELVWDPLSRQESSRLAVLCHRLKDDYFLFQGEHSKPVKAFLDAVIGRLRTSVEEDVFIPLYPKRFLGDSSSPQCRFRDEQFWTAVKLLGSMSLWEGLVSGEALREVMLDQLLNRYLMMTILNDPRPQDSLRKTSKVAECFPESWFSHVSGGSSLPQLLSLSKHLLQIAHSVCKQQPNSPSTREFVSDVLKVLARIKAWDNATALAEKYDYTDLLDALDMS